MTFVAPHFLQAEHKAFEDFTRLQSSQSIWSASEKSRERIHWLCKSSCEAEFPCERQFVIADECEHNRLLDSRQSQFISCKPAQSGLDESFVAQRELAFYGDFDVLVGFHPMCMYVVLASQGITWLPSRTHKIPSVGIRADNSTIK